MGINVAAYKAIVAGPGKFECEPPETAYYWDLYLNGGGEWLASGDPDDEQGDDDTMAWTFVVDAEESSAFGLPIGTVYMVAEDSQGFVIGWSVKDADAAQKTLDRWCGR